VQAASGSQLFRRTALAAMACASLVSYALICVIVMGSKTVWRAQRV
jgi:hypothetical protein